MSVENANVSRLTIELSRSISTGVATEALMWDARAQYAASQCEVWHLKLIEARRQAAIKQSEHELLMAQQPTGD